MLKMNRLASVGASLNPIIGRSGHSRSCTFYGGDGVSAVAMLYSRIYSLDDIKP
jgi:hypothetical protein